MAVSLAPRRSPLSAPGYQVMRTDQRRYFGHPDLVQFIQRLSNQVHNKGMGTVLIGDMGMPAGGRFNGGHASHQTGLDVDIFLQLPQTRWTSSQLLKPQALDLGRQRWQACGAVAMEPANQPAYQAGGGR